MGEVIKIEATKQQDAKLKVAAYCRVSSRSEEQLHSYAAQVQYYRKYIARQADWQFVDIYADEGITGTSAKKREEFQRLLHDCQMGRIDKVLVKSVSRFARNAYDCLKAIRELKENGVSVYFEEQNIDTLAMGPEFFVAIHSTLAQRDSESISGNMQWSYQKRMENGNFITCKAPFGYKIVERSKLLIDEECAEIVRFVFDRYLNGMAISDIADAIIAMGIPTRGGVPYWQYSTILYMLRNEKYAGDALVQKTCVTNTFPQRKVPNKGQRQQYYITNSHPAIIPKEQFEQVQAMLNRRRVSYEPSQEHLFSRKIRCAYCNTVFRKKASQNGHVAWSCRKADVQKCRMKRISEAELEDAFLKMINKLLRHYDTVLEPVKQRIMNLQRITPQLPEATEISSKLNTLAEQQYTLSRLQTKGLLLPEEYAQRSAENSGKILTLKQRRTRLIQAEEASYAEDTLAVITAIRDIGKELLTDFNKSIFEEIVEVTIASEKSLVFKLYGGLGFAEPRENKR